MARINLARRAEIGREKRLRTRAAILEAARVAYASGASGTVTVESVMAEAGLAKGTFYVHFPDLPALEAELGAALVAALDERLQPARLAIADPLARFATAMAIMLRDLTRSPETSRLAGRALAGIPYVGTQIHRRVREDIDAACGAGMLAFAEPELAVSLAAGIFIHVVGEIAASRIGAPALEAVLAATLRAVAAPHINVIRLAADAVSRAQELAPPSTRQAA
jgi:AcrR family transcriptional regulator